MNTATATAILIGKCKTCKTLTKVEREIDPRSGRVLGIVMCKDCNRACNGGQKVATYSATTKCGIRCATATGPECSCECAGRHHGGR